MTSEIAEKVKTGTPRVSRANRNQRKGGRSWLYFIQRGDDGPVKIGFTRGIGDRLHALKTACPEGATLLGMIPETMLNEARAHAVFARHRLKGEWFSPAPEILVLAEAGRRIYEGGYRSICPPDLDDEWLHIMHYQFSARPLAEITRLTSSNGG